MRLSSNSADMLIDIVPMAANLCYSIYGRLSALGTRKMVRT